MSQNIFQIDLTDSEWDSTPSPIRECAVKPRVTGPNNENLEYRVLAGTFHQGDDRFSIESRGRQCTANACVALAYSIHKQSSEWRAYDVDKIISIGDKHYNISKLRKPNSTEYLTFDEIHNYLQIDTSIYELAEDFTVNRDDVIKVAIQGDDIESCDLCKDSLTHFFKTFPSNHGILTCNKYTLAFWREITDSGVEYFLFDSHCRDIGGSPSTDGVGTAVRIRTNSLL